jgi:hypothetical protein
MAVNAAAMGRGINNGAFQLRIDVINTATESSFTKSDLRPGTHQQKIKTAAGSSSRRRLEKWKRVK